MRLSPGGVAVGAADRAVRSVPVGSTRQGRNEPSHLPRIAETLAGLRGWTLDQTATITADNAMAALPRLKAMVRPSLALPA